MPSERKLLKRKIYQANKEIEQATERLYELDEKRGVLSDPDDPMGYSEWFRKLIGIGLKHREFGLQHPMGSCCYRDVLRDDKVQKVLKKAWTRIIINDERPIPHTGKD